MSISDIKRKIKYHEKMRDFYCGNRRSKNQQQIQIKNLTRLLEATS